MWFLTCVCIHMIGLHYMGMLHILSTSHWILNNKHPRSYEETMGVYKLFNMVFNLNNTHVPTKSL